METPSITAEEFALTYAERSGVTVEWLKENGREVRPCDCGDEMCEGWQMAHVRSDLEFEKYMATLERPADEQP